MPIKINSSGGGSVTIDAPVTASNYTVLAPTQAGTYVVADANGRVGLGTNSPATHLDVVSPVNGATAWAWFHGNTGGALPSSSVNSGILLGGNYSAGNSESNIMWGTGYNSSTQYLAFSTYNNSTNAVAEQMRLESNGNLRFNSGYGSVATAYGCRAWVNFNQQGTQAIRGSGNVSSITDNGVGKTGINFTNAMPDTNYAQVIGVGDYNVEFNDRHALGIAGNSTKGTSFTNVDLASSGQRDYADVSIAIFR